MLSKISFAAYEIALNKSNIFSVLIFFYCCGTRNTCE